MNQVRIQKLTDYTSISLAGICVVHCFLMPVALILFPVVGSTFVVEEIFHEMMLFLVIPASVVALFLGCRHHKDFNVIMLGILGLSFLLAGAFVATGYGEYIYRRFYHNFRPPAQFQTLQERRLRSLILKEI